MKFLVLAALLGAGFNAYSQSKAEVETMLDMMEKQGTVSKEQMDMVRAQLKSLNDEDFKKMVEEGKKKMNDPAVKAQAEKLLKQQKAKEGKAD